MPPNQTLPAAKPHRSILRRTVDLTATTKHFEWEVVEGGAFDFVAGQFVSMTWSHEGRELTRAYSIASPPRGDNRFELCLNRVPGGAFSKHLCDLEPGASITFSGPHGFFTVQLPVERDLLFVATGTGIAPIRSMLADLFERELLGGHQAWLLFGVRHAETILYREEFGRWAETRRDFHFVPTLSQPGPGWTGKTGHVQASLRELFHARRDIVAHVCGLRAMVDDVRGILREEWQWDRKQIRSERYD